LALAVEGVRVLLLEPENPERFSDAGFDGRVSAIAQGTALFLAKIGAWQGCVRDACPIEDIRITDQDSPIHVHYDHREVGDVPMGYIVENRHLRHSLLGAVRAHPL